MARVECIRDDEVVRIADKMDASIATFLRSFAAPRILFPQAPLETIERNIGQHRRNHAPYTKGNPGLPVTVCHHFAAVLKGWDAVADGDSPKKEFFDKAWKLDDVKKIR